MSSKQNQNTKSAWWMVLTRPRNEIRRILQTGTGLGFIVFFFFSGFVIFYSYADFFNSADEHLIGQIMAFGLVFGPLFGMFFGLCLSFLLMAISYAADPTHKSVYQFKEYGLASFFIFLFAFLFFISLLPFIQPKAPLIWTAIFILVGGLIASRFQNKLLKISVVGNLLTAWSKAESFFVYLFSFISGGKTPFSRIFSATGWASLNLMLIAIVLIVELRYFEGGNFSSKFNSAEAGISITFLVILRMLFLFFLFWFIHSIIRVVESGFRFSFLKSSIIGIASFLIAGFLSFLLCGKFFTMAMQ